MSPKADDLRRRPAVSVVVPTYHRPALLGAAVRSVLQQDPPDGGFEVVVAVSDPGCDADLRAGRRLTESDPRVRTAVAQQLGPAAARNAGIRVARAPLLAFLDDDCTAQPGWLRTGTGALATADIVQGRTRAAEPVHGYDHSIWVDRLSGFWECCNVFVRREAGDRVGWFDESWNLTGDHVDHMGEDLDFGYRMMAAGARAAFCAEADALHAVLPRTRQEYLRYWARVRYFPRILRIHPQARRAFHHGYFLTQRHATFWASVVSGLTATRLRRGAGRPLAAVLAGGAAAGLLWPSRGAVSDALRHPGPRRTAAAVRTVCDQLVDDTVRAGACLYGSVRWRRLLL